MTTESTELDLPLTLAAGVVTLEDWENWLFCDAIGAHPSYTDVHPGLLTAAAVRGTRVPVAEIVELLGGRLEDGPVVAGQQLEMKRPLQIGVQYRVEASITAVKRKTGKRRGEFDLVTYVVSLFEGMEPVATSLSQIVIPR